MKLKELIPGIQSDLEIEGIAYDSRKVQPGYLFVAIKGFNADGHRFIPQAIERGAVAVVHERDYSPPLQLREKALFIPVENTRIALSEISSRFFGEPSKRLKVIGITGTNGKTTTSTILYRALNMMGHKCGLMGTIQYDTVCRREKARLTTPESLEIHAMMREVLECGGEYHVMEVSSHSLALHRVEHVDFDVAIFTNLTMDHLDFHGSMESYMEAKLKLFRNLRKDALSVINRDDPHSEEFIRASSGRVITYSLNEKSDVRGEILENSLKEGLVISIEIDGKIYILMNRNFIGKFNAYNLLAAFATLLNLDFEPSLITEILSRVKPPRGRLTKIRNVFIDYAHTPDALENVLKTLKEVPHSRLIVVFGAGGNRDRNKRPLMGKIAEKYADVVILTSDNPRWEDPMDIIRDIESGMEREHIVEPNREKAILRAIDMADKEDIVLIAGKGHEDYQEIKGERIPFDDELIVRKALNEFEIPGLNINLGDSPL